jgi:1-acyl-sn-glycerol-3-phosphate acyltransferase
MSHQTHLLRSRRFMPLFVTQFLGALNDNVIKNAMVVLLTFQAASWTTLKPEVLANLAAGLFILPFFLFSATAGQLADKYDKARLARLSKVLEIAIVLIAGVGFMMQDLTVLMISLFLLGLQSTVFGPVKYAILPQHLREVELVGGNALIEAGTFVAILIGTLLGGLLAGTAGATSTITLAGLVIAIVGYLASRGIPLAQPPAPNLAIDLNPVTATWRTIRFAQENRSVFLSILGISWFWLYGALLLAQFPAYTKNVLGGGETAVTLLLGVFTFGIGVGSLLCERLSAGKVELGLVPFGSIGLTLFGLDLALASPAGPPTEISMGAMTLLAQANTWRILGDLMLIGIFGGFFIVPLYAMVQQRSSEKHRARVIAANNIFNALFMVGGAIAAALLLSNGLSIPALFATAAVCNAAVALFIYGLVPEFLMRFIVWILVHTIYRLRIEGMSRIPDEGPALIVCNHVSSVDALVIMAGSRRPIRFVVTPSIACKPILGMVLRESRAIVTLASPGTEGLPEETIGVIASALEAGDLVAIFPEGNMTPDGEVGPCGNDIARIMRRMSHPVIPLALRGLWGSLFSRKPVKPVLGKLFCQIELVAGAPLNEGEVQPDLLSSALRNLRGDTR